MSIRYSLVFCFFPDFPSGLVSMAAVSRIHRFKGFGSVPSFGASSASGFELERIEGRSAADAARHRRLEQLRDRLLEDDEVLTEFAQEHPAVDLQALRTLIRNARREQKEGRPPRAFRELFRVLRETSIP